MPLRYFSRFERADGSESAIFKTNRYEYEHQQPLQAASAALVGADYSFDQLGSAPGLKTNAVERVRFLDVHASTDEIDADIDDFNRIQGWGIGKIVTTGAAGERWAWGRPTEMPQISFTVDNYRHLPVMINFERSSDFFGLAHDDHFDVSDPSTISVVNGGNQFAYDPIIIVKGPAIDHPAITNNSVFLPGTTTPYKLESTSTLTASTDWLKFDAQRNEVMISHDSGATWADDSAHLVLQSGQLRLMLFRPGPNSLLVDDITGDLEILFTEAWH